MGANLPDAILATIKKTIKIILVDGGKGGTGKSIVCMLLIDAVRERGGRILIVDSDPKNPEIGLTYQDAEFVERCLYLNLSEKEGFFALIDAIAESTADYCIINSPAGSAKWDQFGALLSENLHEINATFQILWVLGRMKESIKQLIAFEEMFQGTSIVPVVNTYWGSPEKFDRWNKSEVRKRLLARNIPEIIFPETADRIMDTIEEGRRRWDDEADTPLSFKLECRRFRAACWAALAPIL